MISSTTSADGFVHVDGKRKIDYILYREVDGVKTVNNSAFFSQFTFAYHVHVAYGKYRAWAGQTYICDPYKTLVQGATFRYKTFKLESCSQLVTTLKIVLSAFTKLHRSTLLVSNFCPGLQPSCSFGEFGFFVHLNHNVKFDRS